MIDAASVVHVAPQEPEDKVAYWRLMVPLEVEAPALRLPADVFVPLNTGRTAGDAVFVAMDAANRMITVPEPPLLPATPFPPAPPPPVPAVPADGAPAPEVPDAPPPVPPEPGVALAPEPPPPPPTLSAVPRMCHSPPSAPFTGQLFDEHEPDADVHTPLPPFPPLARNVPPDAVPPAPPALLWAPELQIEPVQLHPLPPLPPFAVRVVPPAVTDELPPDPPVLAAHDAPDALAAPPAPIVIVTAPLTGRAEWYTIAPPPPPPPAS